MAWFSSPQKARPRDFTGALSFLASTGTNLMWMWAWPLPASKGGYRSYAPEALLKWS